ncbi:hypothetical protein [Sphingomonas sp. MMS24-J13]|uniref:hypothetical protein n=1 Tax=Sphingomonas sp. MMS24-J13 TaxID=3238686 RepID=UPI00384E4B15
MAHRVAIIGQSNSILHTGFVAHLMHRPEIELGHMGRIGGSPLNLLPFYATPEWLAGHDVCILDIAVADQVFLWADAIDPAAIAQYLGYALQMIHAAGCLPLVLIIPHKSVLPHVAGGGKVPLLHQIYRAVAARYDAMLLDLTDGLDHLGRRSRAALEAAYADPNHLAEATQRDVADRIVALIAEAAATSIERHRVSSAIPNFDRLGLAGLCPQAPAILQLTSLYKARFTVISPGDRLALPTGQFDQLHAVLVNRSRSNAKLVIEGNQTVVKAMGTGNERSQPFVAQLCPVTTPVRDRDGIIALSFAHPNAAVTEASFDPLEDNGGTVEISELLVERGWRVIDFDMPSLPPSLALPAWQPRLLGHS